MLSIFSCDYWPSVSSLKICLFRSFAHFLDYLGYFDTELYELFVYFGI